MTGEEFAKKLNISVHYLEHHFPQIKKSWERKGYILVKIGRGKSAQYGMRRKDEVYVDFIV